MPLGGRGLSCRSLIGPWGPREGAMRLTCAFPFCPCRPRQARSRDHLADAQSFLSCQSLFAHTSCWGRHFFCPELSGAPYPFLQKSDFFVFFGSPSREKGQKQTNFFLSQLKEEEPVGAECAQWSCGHLQGPLYSMGAIWGVEWEEKTAGGGNTVIYGGNIVYNLE